MSKDFYLSLGPGKNHHFSLPPQWVPVHFLESGDTGPIPPVAEMTAAALNSPIGIPSLPARLSEARRITVIVDDATRPTPVAEVLGRLLPFLKECGCPQEAVTIFVALGTHVAMTRDALESRLGKAVVELYEIVQHNAWQPDLVPIQLKDGRVVHINPVIATSDFKIGISSILPHPMAGYGGGPKLLMPGVCDIRFIVGHHMRHGIHAPEMLGLAKTNPFHEDCMLVAKSIGLDLTIDCVYDRQGRVASIVAGSLDETFTEATNQCFERLGHRFPEKVDVSICSSYPHTHGIQIYKGLAAPDIVTREDGAILLVAPMATAVPDEFIRSFVRVQEESHGDAIAFVTDAMTKGQPFLPDQSAEFNMAMSYAIRRSRMRTIIVAPLMPKETALTLGFEYAGSFEEGLETLKRSYPDARVAIFPTGGLIVPITDWDR